MPPSVASLRASPTAAGKTPRARYTGRLPRAGPFCVLQRTRDKIAARDIRPARWTKRYRRRQTSSVPSSTRGKEERARIPQLPLKSPAARALSPLPRRRPHLFPHFSPATQRCRRRSRRSSVRRRFYGRADFAAALIWAPPSPTPPRLPPSLSSASSPPRRHPSAANSPPPLRRPSAQKLHRTAHGGRLHLRARKVFEKTLARYEFGVNLLNEFCALLVCIFIVD